VSDLFARAQAWPLLLLVPVVALLLWALDHARSRRLVLAIGPRLRPLAGGWSAARRRIRRWLFLAALLLAGIAWLQPVWGEVTRTVEHRGVDVLVCLDVSRSMRARDADPDRLECARGAIRALAGHAAGDRLGLVAFAGEARLIVPLTRDRKSFVDLLAPVDTLSVERGGTDLGAALTTALGALPEEGGDQEVILLLTDGEDHGGSGLRAAQRCRARGVVVHTIGFGSQLGAKIPLPGEGFLRDRDGNEVVSALDPATLRAIAEATGGVFTDGLASREPLVALYDAQVAPMARRLYASETRRLRENRFQWPLMLAFLLWIVELGLTEKRR